MAKIIYIKQDTDYQARIHFRNKDKTDFNLTDYASATGKVVVKYRKKGTTTWTEKTISVYDATGGILIWEWSTTETVSMAAGEWECEFLLFKNLVGGEYVVDTSDKLRFPNNLKKYQKVIVIESATST